MYSTYDTYIYYYQSFLYRFHVDLFGNTESEFVWMKNPGNLDASGGGWSDWEQHLLIKNGTTYIHILTNIFENTVK